MELLKRALATTVLVGAAVSTQAGVIDTYDDKTAFLAATNASSITGTLPNLGVVGTTPTIGDLTLSTTAFSTSSSIIVGSGWSSLIPGNEIAISGTENLDVAINLAGPLFSFGFDFHEPTAINQVLDGTNTPFAHESIYTLELFDTGALVGSTVFDPVSDQLEFFGLVSDMSFDSVRISENLAGQTYAGGIDISNDNEFFGEFYAGGSVVADVSEPPLLALLGLAMAFLARRKI